MLAQLRAAVFVFDELPMIKLGKHTVLQRVLTNLTEVRGMTEIAIYSVPKLFEAANKLAKKVRGRAVKLNPTSLPQAQTAFEAFRAWYFQEHATDQPGALLVFPYLPFAPEWAYEACIRDVRRNKGNSVLSEQPIIRTARTANTFQVQACTATLPSLMQPAHVKLSKLEALDIRNHDDLVIASALVTAKKMI